MGHGCRVTVTGDEPSGYLFLFFLHYKIIDLCYGQEELRLKLRWDEMMCKLQVYMRNESMTKAGDLSVNNVELVDNGGVDCHTFAHLSAKLQRVLEAGVEQYKIRAACRTVYGIRPYKYGTIRLRFEYIAYERHPDSTATLLSVYGRNFTVKYCSKPYRSHTVEVLLKCSTVWLL
ncbi:hypothetical protein BDQ12DRAFT_668112 [Crucibulum laeve]|uniref:Uncharacterized protein n=1 Tax=Crucibulum laeve TaxID=68775 RepID=A0A5C3LU77_9AGAR|nr:hypothetical protein BDQ12DRAFT_668112 [Crucibulum laeve]